MGRGRQVADAVAQRQCRGVSTGHALYGRSTVHPTRHRRCTGRSRTLGLILIGDSDDRSLEEKSMPAIWRVPEELWEKIEPILAERDPPQRTGRPAPIGEPC